MIYGSGGFFFQWSQQWALHLLKINLSPLDTGKSFRDCIYIALSSTFMPFMHKALCNSLKFTHSLTQSYITGWLLPH